MIHITHPIDRTAEAAGHIKACRRIHSPQITIRSKHFGREDTLISGHTIKTLITRNTSPLIISTIYIVNDF